MRGQPSVDPARSEPAGARLARTILDLAGRIPASGQTATSDPHGGARALTRAAAREAALTAGTLALPPGPLGWLTIAPELALIWRIQRQLVADIAALHGVEAELTRTHLLYCLFRHAAAQALRELTVRAGTRLLLREVPLHALERIATRVGLQLTARTAGRSLARWLPVAGTLGVAGYAWYDTSQVARTALTLFGGAAPPPPHRARHVHIA